MWIHSSIVRKECLSSQFCKSRVLKLHYLNGLSRGMMWHAHTWMPSPDPKEICHVNVSCCRSALNTGADISGYSERVSVMTFCYFHVSCIEFVHSGGLRAFRSYICIVKMLCTSFFQHFYICRPSLIRIVWLVILSLMVLLIHGEIYFWTVSLLHKYNIKTLHGMKEITEKEKPKLKLLNPQIKNVALRKTELAIYLPLYLEKQKT